MVTFSVDAKDAGKDEGEKMRRLADLARFLDLGCDRSLGAILRRNNVEVYVIRILIQFFRSFRAPLLFEHLRPRLA